MSLATGTRLGLYEVTAFIGEGGMGEVYRALDTKLKRQVALKILPSSVAADAGRLARFEREAEVLASLNHPNIAQIYGVEDAADVKALVMELVEGDDLAARLARGAIPLDEALPLARQIADALAAAHDRGVIHRDLKPANIKVRPDGTVKVLDFGLAKAIEPASVSPNVSHVATMTSPVVTEAGMLLGTAAYLSPEQARGKPVDKRADIWAFGCVFYEMLTGRRLIAGDTVSDTLAAVLRDEPDWTSVPLRVRRLLARCLEKDPAKRLRDIGDAWVLLDEPVRPERQSRSAALAVFAAIASMALVVAVWGWWRATRAAPNNAPAVLRLDVDLGAGVDLPSDAGASVIISPAGDRLVYVSQSRLFTRTLDAAAASELPGTEGAVAPFFSPDGEWVGFFTPNWLKKVSIHGGTPMVVCQASANARGGAWGDDGWIVAAFRSNGVALSRVSAAGGTPEPLTTLDPGRKEVTHRWPQLLPGGRAVLFTAHNAVNAFDDASIEVFSFADRQRRTIHRGGTFGRYVGTGSGDGYLLYVSQGTLFAERFDPVRFETLATPIPAIDRVAYAAGFGSAEFDVARNGTLVFRSGAGAGRGLVTLQYIDRAGKTEPFLPTPGDYLFPSLAPDGNRVVLVSGDDLVIYDRRRETTERLAKGGGFQYPLWSPDGRFILFRGAGGIFWTRADGAFTPRPLLESTVAVFPWAFTADGSRLAVQEMDVSKDDYNVLTASVTRDGDGLHAGPAERFLATPAREGHPAISPDGKWMAYMSDAPGTREIFVRAYPDTGRQWQLSNAGGVYPTWSRKGRELLYRTDDNRVMVVPYEATGADFVAGRPQAWTEQRLANVGQFRNFDAAPDGRIIALLPVGQKDQDHRIVLVSGFLEQLRRAAAH